MTRKKSKTNDPAETLLDAFIHFRLTMDPNNPNQRALYLGLMMTKLGKESTFKMNKAAKAKAKKSKSEDAGI
jgi:hypothetical protein